jgi:hypothetical protein
MRSETNLQISRVILNLLSNLNALDPHSEDFGGNMDKFSGGSMLKGKYKMVCSITVQNNRFQHRQEDKPSNIRAVKSRTRRPK